MRSWASIELPETPQSSSSGASAKGCGSVQLPSVHLAMGHNLCLHFGADHPCTTYFDVHQGYRVLTHSHLVSNQKAWRVFVHFEKLNHSSVERLDSAQPDKELQNPQAGNKKAPHPRAETFPLALPQADNCLLGPAARFHNPLSVH